MLAGSDTPDPRPKLHEGAVTHSGSRHQQTWGAGRERAKMPLPPLNGTFWVIMVSSGPVGLVWSTGGRCDPISGRDLPALLSLYFRTTCFNRVLRHMF